MARKDELSRRAAPCGQVSFPGTWRIMRGPVEECIRRICAIYVPTHSIDECICNSIGRIHICGKCTSGNALPYVSANRLGTDVTDGRSVFIVLVYSIT